MRCSPSANRANRGNSVNGEILRRAFHFMAPLFLLYYLLPARIEGYDKTIIPLLMILIVAVFEAVRIGMGFKPVGLREYEHRRPASFAYAIVGFALCFMFFPLHVSAPAFMGLAFVDPLIGHIDGGKKQFWRGKTSWIAYPGIPLSFYALLAFSWLRLGANLPFLESAILSASMAVVAIAVEKPSNPWLDDDFLMIFVPAAFLHALALTMGIAW